LKFLFREKIKFTREFLFSIFILISFFVNLASYAHDIFDENAISSLEKIIEIWVKENPKKIRSVLKNLEKEEEINKNKETYELLANNFLDPIIGNPSADVIIYEFFDYNCGYCKSVYNTMLKVVERDKKIKFVLKEFPILSQSSVDAAYFALASNKQNLYPEFHSRIMQYRGRITKEILFKTAENIGIDIDKLKEDLNSNDIKLTIEKNKDLAKRLNINGTPSFVIGKKIIPGAINEEQLIQLIEEERKNNS
tara:strand:- start:752 stop:1507 length:756 start_codon:yes stop_codon:yes gene_type:complete